MPKEKRSFKERWGDKDTLCQSCGHVIKEAIGVNKQNIKKLFKKPTLQDLIVFIMLVLVLIGAYTYQLEVKQYKELIQNPEELCMVYYQSKMMGNFGEPISAEELVNILIINQSNEGKN